MTRINVQSITPLTSLLDHATVDTDSMCGKRTLQALQYVARPIDNVIKIIAFLVFETWTHFNNIVDDFQSGNKGMGVVKLLLTPVTLPLSLLVNGTLLTIRVALETAFDIIIPVRTILDIADPQNRAEARIKSHPDSLLWFKWDVIDVKIKGPSGNVSDFKIRFVM